MHVKFSEFPLLENEYAFKDKKNQILEYKRINDPLSLMSEERNFDEKFHEDRIDNSSSLQYKDIDLDLRMKT